VPASTDIAAGRVTAQHLSDAALVATALNLATALDLAATLELAATLDLAFAPELAFALELAATLDLAATLELAFAPELAFALELAAATTSIKIASYTISALPTLPAISPAPAKAPARTITAPVPAGALPSAVIPAVPSPTEDELSVFHHIETIDRDAQAVGRSNRRSFGTSTHQHPARK
jgi:hypothetical protein